MYRDGRRITHRTPDGAGSCGRFNGVMKYAKMCAEVGVIDSIHIFTRDDTEPRIITAKALLALSGA